MRRLIKILKESEIVIVTTDTTNRIRSMKKEEYKTMVKEHLNKSVIEIERGRVTEIFDDAKVIVDAIWFKLSKNEVGQINESLKIKAIPTPKLLIKYPKILTSMGEFPTRLVITAVNFSASFAKVGYLGLKNILKKN